MGWSDSDDLDNLDCIPQEVGSGVFSGRKHKLGLSALIAVFR